MTHIAPVALLWLVVAQAPPTILTAPPTAPTGVLTAAETRAAFHALVDRPEVPLDVRVTGRDADGKTGLVAERLSFAAERKADGSTERVPVLVVRPADDPAGVVKRRPAVVVLHGTGGNKEMMRPWLVDLARLGFVALAIDGRYHGERGNAVVGVGPLAYFAAITRAWRSLPVGPQEHPLYYDTCWDVWRTLDYLETRDDVDPKRMGLAGVSKGGIETWLSAAADERVAAAVPMIGVQSLRWGLEHEKYQARANTFKPASEAAARDLGVPAVDARVCRALWDKVIPGITGPFDGPRMLAAIAGRPLLVLNGELDPNCPIEGVRLAVAEAEAAYRAAGAPDRLKVMIAPGVGHAVTPEQHQAALDWLARWLKP